MNRGKMTSQMTMDMQRLEVDGISTDPHISKMNKDAAKGEKKNMQPNTEMPLRCPLMAMLLLCLTWKATGSHPDPHRVFQGGNRQNSYATAEKTVLEDTAVMAALEAAGYVIVGRPRCDAAYVARCVRTMECRTASCLICAACRAYSISVGSIGVHSRRKTAASAYGSGRESMNFAALCMRGGWAYGTPTLYVSVRINVLAVLASPHDCVTAVAAAAWPQLLPHNPRAHTAAVAACC
jgi:hypothetical protein